jgi:hypothetical protein
MLFGRLYKPTNDELLYHYCGADAFAQIIRTRTIWHGVQVPYVVLDMTDGGKNAPIKEIVLGPKNRDKEADVEKLLTDAGWKGVKVRRSDVPYV